MDLSIIIPIYNVEQWIERCIDSCLQIEMVTDTFEIILVDDGSTDNSGKIADRYAIYHNNITVIHRPNGGLSVARNTGIHHAKGKYIWFVDSDDWIEPKYVAALIYEAIEADVDICCFGLKLAFEDGRLESYSIVSKLIPGQVVSGETFVSAVGMPPAAWAAFYKRSFLTEKKFTFMENIYHEDYEFTTRAYAIADRIVYNDVVIYNYYQRSGSIMKSSQGYKRAADLLKIADSLHSFQNTYFEKRASLWHYFDQKISFIVSQSLAYYRPQYFPLKVYTQKPYFPLKYRGHNSFKEKIKYTLINFSPRLYCWCRYLFLKTQN